MKEKRRWFRRSRRTGLREQDRQLEAVEAVSKALGRAGDAEAVARVLLDEIARLVRVDFAGLALVNDERTEARGLLARRNGEDFDYWRDVVFDLAREPSGVASAVFEAAPVTVYDVGSSPQVNQRVADAVGAKSAAFLPLLSGERVIGVLAVASTIERRSFSTEDLGPMRALAAEAALALERALSSSELADALDRERVVAEIARRVRSELDVDTLHRVAVEETGRALGVDRCFIRIGEPGGPMPVVAEWFREGLQPIAGDALLLPISNLAARRLETVAIADVQKAAEVGDDHAGLQALARLGTAAALATPIAVFDRMIGVFAAHRTEPAQWTRSEISLMEAVAREIGLAIHIGALLRENQVRLEQQTALLEAAQVVTSELRLETGLQLFVDQVKELLSGDAADCYLFDSARGTLTCAAVRGLDSGVVGYEFVPDRGGLAGKAIAERAPVRSNEYRGVEVAVPHPAYDEFEAAIVAPMIWSGEILGVIGVGLRDPARVFTESDAELLRGFATLASLALRNAELFEERLRRARIERGFARIASALSGTVSLGETLDAIAQAAVGALAGSFSAVLTPSPRGFELGGRHQLPEALEAVLGDGLPAGADALEHAARERRTLAASSLHDDDRFGGGDGPLVRASGSASLLAVPVPVPRSEVAALTLVFFAKPHPFTDEDVEVAEQLADAAKSALERAEAFETERRSRALSQQLARTSSLLTGELDPRAVLDDVVEQAPALLRVDTAGIRVLEGNELVLTAAAGRDTEELVGHRISAAARPAGQIVQTGAPVALEDVGDDPRVLEGEPLLGQCAAYLGVPLRGQEGAPTGVLVVCSASPREWREEEIEALTALAANASAALANAELYQQVALERETSLAILGNVADGIVAVDPEGRVVLWNAAAEEITGVPSTEALGRTTAQVIQRELASLGDAPAGERHVSIRRGSEDVHLSLTESVMRDPAGAVAGRIFTFRDISKEHVVEQMKSQFVSTVSHQLRGPLTSIYGFAETLRQRWDHFADAERIRFLDYISDASEQLSLIVDQLLNVARLEGGDLPMKPTAIDVRPVVAEVVAGVERDVADGHTFLVDVPDEPISALADSEKLRQIVGHLVDNAVKFSPEGGLVRVTVEQQSGVVAVSVSDEGVGIPPGEQERIFTKFYRRESGRGGTGLGLFLAQGLVERMGGRIRLESVEGEGSTFTIELPAARSSGRTRAEKQEVAS